MTLQTGPPRSSTGTVIGGRYRLDGVIGRGGMSVVHVATDLALGRRVAVKVIADDLAERDRRRLDDELSLLAGFDHPGLVTVFDAVRTGGGDDPPAVVMQLIDGKDLAQRLAVSPLAPPAVARLGADIASALAYLAERGVVHRDVKPANILLTADCRARLTDFGIAQLVGSRGPTGTGTIIGTMRYLSPEQVRGQPATAASDVYALGLVLLEALTGRPAFGGTDAEAAAARLTAPPVIPGALGPAWSGLLAAMTTVDATQRCTAGWAAGRLSDLAEAPFLPAPRPRPGPASGPATTRRLPTPVAPPRAHRSRRIAIVLAALAASAVLISGALGLAGESSSPGPRTQADLVVPAQTPAEPVDPGVDQGDAGNGDDGNPGNGNNGNGNGNNGNGNGGNGNNGNGNNGNGNNGNGNR